MRLQFWRESIVSIFQGEIREHPVLQVLSVASSHFNLSKSAFLRVITARLEDLSSSQVGVCFCSSLHVSHAFPCSRLSILSISLILSLSLFSSASCFHCAQTSGFNHPSLNESSSLSQLFSIPSLSHLSLVHLSREPHSHNPLFPPALSSFLILCCFLLKHQCSAHPLSIPLRKLPRVSCSFPRSNPLSLALSLISSRGLYVSLSLFPVANGH
jgi:Squalene/phytoene synthase